MRVSCSLLPSALIGNVLGWAGGDTRNVKDVPCFFQELAVNTAVFTLTGMLHNTICHCSSNEWPWTRPCSRPTAVCTLARGAQKHYFAGGLKNRRDHNHYQTYGRRPKTCFHRLSEESPSTRPCSRSYDREHGHVHGQVTMNRAMFTAIREAQKHLVFICFSLFLVGIAENTAMFTVT